MPYLMCGSNAGRIAVSGMPRVVPADFVGMAFRGWPLYNPTFWAGASQPFPSSQPPAPTGLRWGSTRILDTGVTYWSQIETSQGVYDWANLDTVISAYKQGGRSTYYTLYSTPLFYVSDATDRSRTDMYLTPGGAAYPGASGGLTGVSNFMTALINRYNKPGGAWYDANFSALGKGIQAVEIWNEPVFLGYPGFWWGTVGQFVDMAWTAYQAVKAADSTVNVSNPGAPYQSALQDFLNGYGAINTTKRGADCCDVISVHNYQVNLPGIRQTNWPFDFITGLGRNNGAIGIEPWRLGMANAGVSNYPLWMNEGGFDYDEHSPAVAVIAAQTPEWRYRYWARTMMLGAAFGFARWTTYCWDAPYSSFMMADPNGMQRALNLIHDSVAGRTIVAASYVNGGDVSLTFASGPSLTV